MQATQLEIYKNLIEIDLLQQQVTFLESNKRRSRYLPAKFIGTAVSTTLVGYELGLANSTLHGLVYTDLFGSAGLVSSLVLAQFKVKNFWFLIGWLLRSI